MIECSKEPWSLHMHVDKGTRHVCDASGSVAAYRIPGEVPQDPFSGVISMLDIGTPAHPYMYLEPCPVHYLAFQPVSKRVAKARIPSTRHPAHREYLRLSAS